MYHDYTGKELYKARQQDLMKEAEGGWRLKAAGVDRSGLSSPRRLILAVIGALVTVLLIAQRFAG